MATPHDTKIDIPLVLWRLNSQAEYHWKGDGWGTYADIGEWRSSDIPKPSEAAVYSEWDVYLSEQVRVTSTEIALRNRIAESAQSAVGTPVDQLNAAQVRVLLVLLLQKEGAISAEGSIKPLDTWAT